MMYVFQDPRSGELFTVEPGAEADAEALGYKKILVDPEEKSDTTLPAPSPTPSFKQPTVEPKKEDLESRDIETFAKAFGDTLAFGTSPKIAGALGGDEKAYRGRLEKLEEANPIASLAGRAAASITHQAIPGIRELGPFVQGALHGAGTAYGQGQGALGIASGGLIGGVTGKLFDKLVKLIDPKFLKEKGQDFAKSAAEGTVKAIGMTPSAYQKLAKKDLIPKISDYLKEKDIVKLGSTPETMHQVAEKVRRETGEKIGEIYKTADEQFQSLAPKGKEIQSRLMRKAKDLADDFKKEDAVLMQKIFKKEILPFDESAEKSQEIIKELTKRIDDLDASKFDIRSEIIDFNKLDDVDLTRRLANIESAKALIKAAQLTNKDQRTLDYLKNLEKTINLEKRITQTLLKRAKQGWKEGEGKVLDDLRNLYQNIELTKQKAKHGLKVAKRDALARQIKEFGEQDIPFGRVFEIIKKLEAPTYKTDSKTNQARVAKMAARELRGLIEDKLATTPLIEQLKPLSKDYAIGSAIRDPILRNLAKEKTRTTLGFIPSAGGAASAVLGGGLGAALGGLGGGALGSLIGLFAGNKLAKNLIENAPIYQSVYGKKVSDSLLKVAEKLEPYETYTSFINKATKAGVPSYVATSIFEELNREQLQ